MNRILIAILVTLIFQACVQVQEKVILEKPKVDKRVELLSIVFRLAERPEYSGKIFPPYIERIEQHFEKYKNHELIQFSKSIIKENQISYDAPMWMAVHLDENLKLLTGVKENIWQKDERWTEENVKKFVLLLQQFAKDTNFDDFFKNNADLYDETIKRFASFYEQIDLNWYLSFYGQEPTETFSIIIGAGNGTSNYGPLIDYIDGSRNVYAIVGGVGGMFEYHPFAWIVVIHEFNHSFVNWLIYKNIEAFRESGEKIFSVIKDVLANQAYGDWETMMCEALVRAAEIKYIKDQEFEQGTIEEKINREKENGFFWIEELVDELESYDKQRDIYPTLESYMPRLIEAYKIWAENIQNK